MTMRKTRRKSKKAKRISLAEKQRSSDIKLVEVVVPEPVAEAEESAKASVTQSDVERVLSALHAVSLESDSPAFNTSELCDGVANLQGCTAGAAATAAADTDDDPVGEVSSIATAGQAPFLCDTAPRNRLPAWLQGVFEFEKYMDDNVKSIGKWLWGLRAPLLVLMAIALQPKFVLLWILIILVKPFGTWLFESCPQEWKYRLADFLPSSLRKSPLLRDLGEGADQGLPFILFWLYLFCAPFAIAWIALHWVRSFWRAPSDVKKVGKGFVFAQNRKPDVHSEVNFYYSRAFSVVMLAFFILGVPTFISYAIYENLGVEKILSSAPVGGVYMDNPSTAPEPIKVKIGLATRLKPGVSTINHPMDDFNVAVIAYNGYWPFLQNFGLEPTKATTIFVHFYLVSLASVLSILFFRAWFLFPLNFVADDHDVEVTESGVKRKSMLRGWFLSVITVNRWAIGSGVDWLQWAEVKSLRRLEEGFLKLSPLPETAFKRESLAYKLLNKIAVLIDGVSSRPTAGNYLVFSSSVGASDFGRNIKINLNDLSREQRAKLYYAVKTWAPHVVVGSAVEEQLIGSSVLTDNRYTQLWFDILTDRTPRNRAAHLGAGESLKRGEYTVESRISSGGQATTYLASNGAGQKFALKEFVLSTSTTSGAQIESAREFEAEVSLLSQLEHSGIVRLEDFFSERGRLYVVLEYIEGQSLRQKVASEGALPEHEVVRIALATCDVLSYLHSCSPPIVHRDITPENILLDAHGNVKVIDFSLAVRQDGRQTTDSCAKQAFTPPEQFREEVCIQSDIYSLGATMHFLLTGRTPKPISVSSPRLIAEGVSLGLNEIVERATQLDLDRRYEAVDWLQVELLALQDSAVGARATLRTTGRT